MTDGAIQRKLSDDHGAIGRDEHLYQQNAVRDGKVVGGAFFANVIRNAISALSCFYCLYGFIEMGAKIFIESIISTKLILFAVIMQ